MFRKEVGSEKGRKGMGGREGEGVVGGRNLVLRGSEFKRQMKINSLFFFR